MNDLPPTDNAEWPPTDNAEWPPTETDNPEWPPVDNPEWPPVDPAASEVSPEPTPETTPEPTSGLTPMYTATPNYLGNRQDMTAFLAMLAGVGSIAMSCIPCGGCIPPVFALVAGSIALKDARMAVNPDRARQHALIGLACGLVLTLGLLAFISLYAMFIGAAIAMSGGAR